MRIAYVGSGVGTSLQRLRALQRLGHQVVLIDPSKWLKGLNTRSRSRLFLYTGYIGVTAAIGPRLLREVIQSGAELVWVNQVEYLGPAFVRKVQEIGIPIINYANDNPFSAENWLRFRPYRAALPYYHSVVVVFASAVQAAKKHGARHVVRTYLSADEVAHRPPNETDVADEGFQSEVVFVGTWMKGQRGAFIAELIERGVPVSIWGDRWNKAREWPIIKPHWRGPGIYSDEGYAKLIQSAKVCVGLLNKRSGNLHTGRSIQIPALGSVLCAERTDEHLALYRDREEAVFWDDAEECAALCQELLNDDAGRREIACRGHQRALRNGLYNEPVMAAILENALEGGGLGTTQVCIPGTNENLSRTSI